jgi:hypothetical protein
VSANERRPAGAPSETNSSKPSLPDTTHVVTCDIPTLDELSPRGRDIASAYMESGVVVGISMGRQQIEDEQRGRMEVSAAIARQIATSGPWDVLAGLRGDHVRADAQRAILRDRGIA